MLLTGFSAFAGVFPTGIQLLQRQGPLSPLSFVTRVQEKRARSTGKAQILKEMTAAEVKWDLPQRGEKELRFRQDSCSTTPPPHLLNPGVGNLSALANLFSNLVAFI